MEPIQVLFVCTGNICRSPTAEGVFRNLVAQNNFEGHFIIDSAGTHNYHVGHQPDERAQFHARQRGVDISKQRARQLDLDDFSSFDYIIAMDQFNLENIDVICPAEAKPKVKLLLEFNDRSLISEVPDPYYNGDQSFIEVFEMIEAANLCLLDYLMTRHFKQ